MRHFIHLAQRTLLIHCDAHGKLTGVASEGDFVRRAEIGTQRKHARCLTFLRSRFRCRRFLHERGPEVGEVMTQEPFTVTEILRSKIISWN